MKKFEEENNRLFFEELDLLNEATRLKKAYEKTKEFKDFEVVRKKFIKKQEERDTFLKKHGVK